MKFLSKKIGNLNCRLFEGDPKAPLLVFFHGYGANMDDLAPIAREMINLPSSLNWIFPDGIHKLDFMPGFEGRAWFPLSLSGNINTFDLSEMSEAYPDGMEEARNELQIFFDSIDRPFSKIIIAGFSQGAMMSLDYILHREDNPLSLMMFSGTLIKRKEWELLSQTKKLDYFQSHGIYDELLSHNIALELHNILKHSGWNGDFVNFPGGHTIPPIVIRLAEKFIQKKIKY